MQRRDFLGVLGGAAAWPLAARAQKSVMPVIGLTAEEAQSIAQEAYIYFYPLAIMDVSRKHFTNIEADKMFARGPMNTLSHARTFPPGAPLMPTSIPFIPWDGSV
jgi:hypothetical protein